jgi:hypothetical protein
MTWAEWCDTLRFGAALYVFWAAVIVVARWRSKHPLLPGLVRNSADAVVASLVITILVRLIHWVVLG